MQEEVQLTVYQTSSKHLFQQYQVEKTLCKTLKKENYNYKLFCWIQQSNSTKVVQFYQNYPCCVNKFTSFNDWTPAMYAVRHGNIQLVDYFHSHNHVLDSRNIYNNTVVTVACLSNQIQMLKYLLTSLRRNPNPMNSSPSPLRYSIRMADPQILQLLACNGAYYIFGQICNNIKKIFVSKNEQEHIFVSLITKKRVPKWMIVEDIQIEESPIKQVLRWLRASNFIFVKKGVEKSGNLKTVPLIRIFQNSEYLNKLLQYCVGSGEYLFDFGTQ